MFRSKPKCNHWIVKVHEAEFMSSLNHHLWGFLSSTHYGRKFIATVEKNDVLGLLKGIMSLRRLYLILLIKDSGPLINDLSDHESKEF